MTSNHAPHDAFKDNIADADALLGYTLAFQNQRKRRMRRELRERVGDALNLPAKQREQLDCVESNDLFVVFKPDGSLKREDFDDLRPMLRQSLVAACAALETYVADKTMKYVGAALKGDKLPPRMKDIPLTVGHWADIEERYERRVWGIRSVVDEYIRETSSTAPSAIGKVLSTVGMQDWAKGVDNARSVPKGTTVRELEEITGRRNQIAHSADRKGRGRAAIEPEEVKQHLDTIRSVVGAIDELFAGTHM